MDPSSSPSLALPLLGLNTVPLDSKQTSGGMSEDEIPQTAAAYIEDAPWQSHGLS